MKNLLFISTLLFSKNLFSQQIVIFDKGDVCYLNSETGDCNPELQDKKDFLKNLPTMLTLIL